MADIAAESLNPSPTRQAFSAGRRLLRVRDHARRALLTSGLISALFSCGRARTSKRPPAAPAADAGRDSFIRRATTPARGCPAASRAIPAGGSLHGDTVAGSERWLAADSPHRVPYGLHVHAGGALTIEPCALVLVGPGLPIVVYSGATLRAEGAPDRPIRFGRLDPSRSWQGLDIRAEALAGTSLEGATIEGAGAPAVERGVTAASLRVAMQAGLRAEGLSIVDGAGWGIALVGDGRFANRDSVVELRGLHGEGAVTVEDVNRVADLPRLSFRDNVSSDVRVEARVRALAADARWRSLGPTSRYRLRAATHLLVEGAASPQLTLEAGARVSFGAGAELDVGFGGPGALVLDGDAEHPVVLDGADADRWIGIHLGPRFDAGRSRLANSRVEHAGASSGVVLPTCGCPGAHIDEAAVTFQGVSALPTVSFVAIVDGPATGFAVVVAADSPDYGVDAVGRTGAWDFTRSGVRCAVGAPMRGGGCAAESRSSAEPR
jgi:hypothetical protein